MQRIIIFGNSGSGKSTLAKQLSNQYKLAHLDLDTLAWLDTNPPSRRPIDNSHEAMKQFLAANTRWVIEGCYTDLIELVINQSEEIIFLNPGADVCIENCTKRPWEPHKYSSPEAQNKNLAMLISWIKDYETRTDEFSLSSHRRLFATFEGKKIEYTSNNRNPA